MTISAQQVKELREKTGSGLMECKKALQEADGNVDEAVTILRKKGQATAEKKSGRSTTEGSAGRCDGGGTVAAASTPPQSSFAPTWTTTGIAIYISVPSARTDILRHRS